MRTTGGADEKAAGEKESIGGNLFKQIKQKYFHIPQTYYISSQWWRIASLVIDNRPAFHPPIAPPFSPYLPEIGQREEKAIENDKKESKKSRVLIYNL